MRRTVLFLFFVLCYMTVCAIVPERRMLEQGKTWAYAYHHYEEQEEPGPDGNYYNHTMWMSYYTLDGDTVIDGRQYMMLYRYDEHNYNRKFCQSKKKTVL